MVSVYLDVDQNTRSSVLFDQWALHNGCIETKTMSPITIQFSELDITITALYDTNEILIYSQGNLITSVIIDYDITYSFFIGFLDQLFYRHPLPHIPLDSPHNRQMIIDKARYLKNMKQWVSPNLFLY